MPVLSSELVLFGAASRPEDDVSTAGGAIDAAARPLDVQLSGNAVIAAISDGTDTRTLTVTGRLPSGAIDTEALVLTSGSEVVGAKTFERVLKLEMSAADGARTVTVRQGSGGATIHTVNPNETDAFVMFIGSASEASPTVRYEKSFFRNGNGSLALLGAAVQMTANPSSKLAIGIAAAVDDSVTVADRTTAPGGVTFVGTGVQQNVPGTDLAAGSAIGTWSRLSLAADDSPLKTTHTIELAGTTT